MVTSNLREKDLVILLETLKPATPHWKTVRLALGFLDYELTAIECTPLLIQEGLTERDAEPCQWLKWAPPNHSWLTLEALALALQRSGHEGLAVQLRQKFLQEKGIDSMYDCMCKLNAGIFKKSSPTVYMHAHLSS